MQKTVQLPYTLCQTSQHFYIRCLTTGTLFSQHQFPTPQLKQPQSTHHLKICRRTNRIVELGQEQYGEQLEEVTLSHVIKFYLLLGTIVLNQQPYLLLVVDAQEIAKYVQHQIYMISDLMFLPYRSKRLQKEEDIEEEERVIAELKNNYIADYFYFSYSETLTQSLTTNQQPTFNQFAWNQKLLQPFLLSKLHPCWTIPIIQGFVAQIKVKNQYFCWEYLNISRRSLFMSGTRFNSRGTDEDGHTSNFVQTQQIVKCHNRWYVHMSVRGSVPLFWRQQKARGKINFMKDHHVDQQQVLRKHYQSLSDRYRAKLVTINLLSKQKSTEKELKNRFQALLNRNVEGGYLYFDLNKVMEQNSDGQQYISQFVAKNCCTIFGQQPFTILEGITLTPKCLQSTVPRINCLDCLDRTNVVMARISETFICSAAEHINKEETLAQRKVVIDNGVISKLIKVWAALGDKISNIYCGTGSVATHMTKKQNNSLFSTLGGVLTSFNRYLNASHSDLFKQKCIDSFLGTRGEHSQTQCFMHNILGQIEEGTHCEFTELKVLLLTFDTSHLTPSSGKIHLDQFLGQAELAEYDLVVLCFQEIDGVQRWSRNIQKHLMRRGYGMLIQIDSQKLDLFTMVFSHSARKRASFKYLKMVEVPLRSNGGLAVFIQANDSVLSFINCRFQGGFHNNLFRADDFNQLHQTLLRQTYNSQLLQQSQVVFLAGNFNLRLSNQIQKQFRFKNTIEEIYLAEMNARQDKKVVVEGLEYDQLPLLKKSNYFQYQEAQISFRPTYCYAGKKGGFDRSKPPAWCDRIFFSEPGYALKRSKSCRIAKCLSYKRIEERFGSSHKAVMGTYIITVRTENIQKRDQLVTHYLFGQPSPPGQVQQQTN